jgi:tetratricopeptide (TPR) repeat protein
MFCVLCNVDDYSEERGMRISVYLLSIALVSAWCSASADDDYFRRITMVSDGRITRFPHAPISVYISTPPVPEKLQHICIADVEYALDQWAGCSEGQLQFKQVHSQEADIRIYWTDEPLSGEADPLGEASLVQFDSGEFYVKVSMLLQKKPSLQLPSIHRELRAVLLHELGHAIGLWGHSRDPSDIMYRRSSAIHPTRRDKNTLLKLLSTPPDSPFHENAIAELKSDISRKRDAAYLHFWLGTVYADKGEDDLAIKELLTALKLSPNLLKAAHRLGRIFQEEGMYGKAIAYYSKEAKLEPSPGLHGIIGMLYLRQEKYDKAIDHFEKALRMDSNFLAARTDALVAYHRWVSELIKNHQADKAISILSRALGLFPSSRVVHYDLGTAYDADEQYEKAIEQYKKALEIDPSFVAAEGNIASCMNNLSAEQIRNKNWEDSIELCEQALQWDPDCWEARKNLESATFGLGREEHESGLLDDAAIHYRAVLDMNPSNLDAYSNLGFVFYEKGIYKEALAQFQAALDIDPDFYSAKAGLATVKRRININRAKVAILLTSISMVLCISIIFLSRYRHRRKVSTDY